ncbi:MAG: deoxyguanosinetriphosphate triphosphohydrolase, partial [Actinomycetes bacterium]
MGGHATGEHLVGESPVVRAHAAPGPAVGAGQVLDRAHREELEDAALAPGATRARGAGNRAVPEVADPERTCFERDRDRI